VSLAKAAVRLILGLGAAGTCRCRSGSANNKFGQLRDTERRLRLPTLMQADNTILHVTYFYGTVLYIGRIAGRLTVLSRKKRIEQRCCESY